jgi:hypothetical protein
MKFSNYVYENLWDLCRNSVTTFSKNLSSQIFFLFPLLGFLLPIIYSTEKGNILLQIRIFSSWYVPFLIFSLFFYLVRKRLLGGKSVQEVDLATLISWGLNQINVIVISYLFQYNIYLAIQNYGYILPIVDKPILLWFTILNLVLIVTILMFQKRYLLLRGLQKTPSSIPENQTKTFIFYVVLVLFVIYFLSQNWFGNYIVPLALILGSVLSIITLFAGISGLVLLVTIYQWRNQNHWVGLMN